MGPSVERLSRAQHQCLRRRAGEECVPPILTPHLMATYASTLPWVWKSSIHNILICIWVKQQQLYLIHHITAQYFLRMCIKLHKHSEACLCLGGGDCDPGESHENNVILFGRSEGRRERVVLDTLPYSSYRVRHTQHILTKKICALSNPQS